MLVELDSGIVINTDRILAIVETTVILSYQYHPKLRWWKSSWGNIGTDITEKDRERIYTAMEIYCANEVPVHVTNGRLNAGSLQAGVMNEQ